MPTFLVQKAQTDTDAHGDSFSWQHEEWYVSAPSKQHLLADIALVNGTEINASEYLYLKLNDEVDKQGSPIRTYLSGFLIPTDLVDKLS
jgi:hypothetical protein